MSHGGTTLPAQVHVLPMNDQIRELQTIVCDSRSTSHSDLVFYADRLIRLVVEHGLNQLPYSDSTVRTPTGCWYEGVLFSKGNCVVSICRSGEAMEKGVRECCRSIRIGKILIDSDPSTHMARVLYAKLLPDIKDRRVLLLYPMMGTGNTVVKALHMLLECGVQEEKIFLITLFCAPQSIQSITRLFPKVSIVTSEINTILPLNFGQKYFGTD